MAEYCYAECHYAEFSYKPFVVECRYAEWHYAECRGAIITLVIYSGIV